MDNSQIEVQLAHEKSEWAYAVYVMHKTGGCLYSDRFEYNADKRGDQHKAKTLALKEFNRTKTNYPGCNEFSEV